MAKFTVPSIDGFQVAFNFSRAPFHMRLLARTPYFDRYLYAKAVNLGFGELWPLKNGLLVSDDLKSAGWIIHEAPKSDYERWLEGSLSLLGRSRHRKIQTALRRDRVLKVAGHIHFRFQLIPTFAFTYYGRQQLVAKNVHKMNGTYSLYKRAVKKELTPEEVSSFFISQ